ncbi:PEPxxWA-CTERM sorting domain-containing protein, partial [Sandaracinobacter sp. RS1-74]|uniref:Npun_F0296 family exosortase-dependent surface protein n=1 Tax=Sandaracinobacteroides sayramensis TaxID=2913411 RepID=UPI001EDC2273
MKLWIGAVAAMALVAPAQAAVLFNYEQPGRKNTTATFDYSGVETFNARSVGSNQSFTTTFGTENDPLVITGVYTGVNVAAGNQYGGDNGSNFATISSTTGYTLSLSTSDGSPLTYFGYWLTALDGNNQLEFLKNGEVIATIKPADVIGNTGGCPGAYCGMPDGPFAGQNAGEPYAFINIYFTDGDSFDGVRFYQASGSAGYESDNHTVGYYTAFGGVPEPTTWAMLIAGFGLVGAAARRRR